MTGRAEPAAARIAPAVTGPRGGVSAQRRRRRALAFAAFTLAGLCVVSLASLALGAVNLAPSEVLTGITEATPSLARSIVWDVRLPRLLDGMLVGAALGVAGALLQVVTRNPIADPTILGVTAAAGFATALALAFDPLAPTSVQAAAAIAGGLAGGGIIWVMASEGGVSPIRLALAGVALSSFLGAGIVGLLSSSRMFLQISLGFLAGGLYGAEWRELTAILPVVLPMLAVAWLLAPGLNVLALGEDVASSLGVGTGRTRLLSLGVAGVLTGAAVSVAGLVSFVGLVSPHLARFAVGSDQRYLVPASALTGALLVASADLLARLVLRPSELPMGIITAAVGAPFLLYLVRFHRGV